MADAHVTLIYAHPFDERSAANRELLAGIDGLEAVERRALYDLYPDFDIDPDAERAAVERADLLVLQHPFYWYGMPALLKLWVDEVFSVGWAYGDGGHALEGKSLLWVVTTGGDARAYTPDGPHGHPFEAFTIATRQIARFCGMRWEEPIVVHDAHHDRAHVTAAARRYRERLVGFVKPVQRAAPAAASHLSEEAATQQPSDMDEQDDLGPGLRRGDSDTRTSVVT